MYVHMLPPTHKQLHNYSLTNCVCPGKGAVQEEKPKIIMKCEMTNAKILHCFISALSPVLQFITISTYSPFLPPLITIHLTCFMDTPQYGLQEGYSTYAPHNLLYSTNILKNRRRTITHLLNACKLYTTIGSLAHVHMLPLTHKITQLLTYPLCLSRKGCRARGKTKGNHKV